MSWPNSPAVQTRERDFTTFIAEAATAPGAYVGAFKWGPVESPVFLISRGDLVDRFGTPKSDLFIDFFMVHNYLSYASAMRVVRVVDGDKALNASTDDTPILIKNEDDFEERTDTVATFYAKYPGTPGNSLKVWLITNGNWMDLSDAVQDLFDEQPASGEMHIAVEDVDGQFGDEGDILEIYQYLTTVEGDKKEDGTSAFFEKVINDQSSYIWTSGSFNDYITDDTAEDTLANVDTAEVTLAGGVDGNNEEGSLDDQGLKQSGFEILLDKERFGVSLVPSGNADSTLQDWILQSFCEERKDCVGFFSPPREAAVKNADNVQEDVITWAEDRPSSSYGVMDSGWKYQYDPWNDVNRWLPLNADIAGVTAQSESLTEAWFSPAGYNRGQIKNVIKLSWNPKRPQRDQLFKRRINPVMSEAGEGTILFGDQTMLSRPSAFGEIGVRRLFIILRKSVEESAKYKLFEFNDEITRARFRSQVRPFLRDIQSRRGITGFRVKADDENNTPQIINNNRFYGQIAVRPNRSIRFIRIDFLATPEGVEFEEVLEQA